MGELGTTPESLETRLQARGRLHLISSGSPLDLLPICLSLTLISPDLPPTGYSGPVRAVGRAGSHRRGGDAARGAISHQSPKIFDRPPSTSRDLPSSSQRRTKTELARNAMVCVMLRLLECAARPFLLLQHPHPRSAARPLILTSPRPPGPSLCPSTTTCGSRYYPGVLFLTSNRVRALDPAFQARRLATLSRPLPP